MKTWKQLEDLAKSDRLKLMRTSYGVSIYTTDLMPLSTITAGELEDDDNDKVIRAATEAALTTLRSLDQ